VKVLVTGSSGFVGRHMCEQLKRLGWDVVGVDQNKNRNVLQKLTFSSDSIFDEEKPWNVFVHSDVRTIFWERCRPFSENVFDELAETRYDLVVHCAYHVGGRAAIDGNPSLLALNLELDARLFEWAVRTRQRAVMYFSSSAVYPIKYQQGGKQPPLSEHLISVDGPVQPDARYGWAKLTGEHLADAATTQGLRVHVLRPFSGYGADQDDTYPFPAILARVLAGDLSVWGPPGQIRDWIHIDDVVGGALAVYEKDYREPVNLCTGVGTEFGVLATMMARRLGIDVGAVDPRGRAERVTYLEDRPTGVLCRVGDPTRMLNIYEPEIGLDEGIRRAIGDLT